MKKRKSQTVIFMLTVLLGLTGCGRSERNVVWQTVGESFFTETAETKALDEVFTEGSTENIAGKNSTANEDAVETETAILLYADVCGAVKNPGVYRLEEGARVCDLVKLAGGLTEEADLNVLNQAEKVTDGMKVRVYTKEEAADLQVQTGTGMTTTEATDNGRVNINTADQTQLMALSGIGASRAADIIAYRTEHGSFQTIEEIMNVSGIKESTFQKIKDQIVVE